MCPGTNCVDWKKSIRYEGTIPRTITKMNKMDRGINDDGEISNF